MSLHSSNLHLADARAAMQWTRKALKEGWPVDSVYWLARWMFHWGALALTQQETSGAQHGT